MGIADKTVDAVKALMAENERLRNESHWKEYYQRAWRKAESERDAVIRDIEKIMFIGGGNINTCDFCATKSCYARGGYNCCNPVWKGRVIKEETK